MDKKRVNSPAPAGVKELGGDGRMDRRRAAERKWQSGGVAKPRADAEATAEADPLPRAPRKAPEAFPRSPVP